MYLVRITNVFANQ